MDHRAARRERRDPAMSFSAGCFRVGVCFSFVLQAELFISVLCRERNDLVYGQNPMVSHSVRYLPTILAKAVNTKHRRRTLSCPTTSHPPDLDAPITIPLKLRIPFLLLSLAGNVATMDTDEYQCCRPWPTNNRRHSTWLLGLDGGRLLARAKASSKSGISCWLRRRGAMFKTQSQSQRSQLVVNSSASITIKMDVFVEEAQSRTRHEGMQNNRRAVPIGTRSSGCLVPSWKVSVLDNAAEAYTNT